ncbi:MAG: CerR family C-terminal domain-containing protein [Methylobacter sp.]
MTNTSNQETGNNDARNRLISAALRLFADKGFEAATTREICEAAGANISAIRYYFGDKAGLYRTVFNEPCEKMPACANREKYLSLPLAEALDLFFSDFLTPFKMDENINLVMKLHFREMLEPTGAWQEAIESEIKPQHEALTILLKQHLGLPSIDMDVHRLAFSNRQAVHLFVGQEVIAANAPGLS